jgi:hypothetical protein
MSHAAESWKAAAARFLRGEKPAFATTLVGILLRVYGAEALTWDPTTRRIQIQQDFGVDIPRLEADALEALINAMTTDTAYRSVAVFHRTVTALNRSGLDELDDVPDPEDVAWAVAELAAADPEAPKIPGSDSAYSGDIARYVGVVLDHYGVFGEPGVLKWAQRVNPPVASDAGEDPLMFEAAMTASGFKADEIETELATRIAALLHQLRELDIEPAPIRG